MKGAGSLPTHRHDPKLSIFLAWKYPPLEYPFPDQPQQSPAAEDTAYENPGRPADAKGEPGAGKTDRG